MAALDLTEDRKIGLLIVPSETSAAWTEAVLAAARAVGWPADIFLDRLPAQFEGGAVLASESWPDLQAFAPDYLVVVVPHPDDALSTAARLEVEGERLRYVSHRLAEATMAAQLAQQVVSSSVSEIHIPQLGTISPARQPAGQRARISGSPVSIYETIPPRIGAMSLWPFSIFQLPESGTGSVDLDLTGRARVLMYGPYIELSAGHWRVDLDFEIAVASAKVVPLRIEWGSMSGEAVTSEKIRASGLYRVTLEREWLDVGPAEVRIYLDHAVFDGRLKLVRCEVTHLAAPVVVVAG